MILGISGKRGTGKTTAAQYLVKNKNFKMVSFAEHLKNVCKLLLPFTDNDLSVPAKKEAKFKKYDFTPRDFMIHLGEFMRFHDSDYWINKAMTLCEGEWKYVFDDVRYENEAEVIRKSGGKIIRIERYEKDNPYGKNLDIPSETSLDLYNFDYVIPSFRNNTKTELYTQMDIALSE